MSRPAPAIRRALLVTILGALVALAALTPHVGAHEEVPGVRSVLGSVEPALSDGVTFDVVDGDAADSADVDPGQTAAGAVDEVRSPVQDGSVRPVVDLAAGAGADVGPLDAELASRTTLDATDDGLPVLPLSLGALAVSIGIGLGHQRRRTAEAPVLR